MTSNVASASKIHHAQLEGRATQASVLVIGAGPTGLALAIDLARRGVAVRIVDKTASLSYASRGKGIQPRTLEVFDDLGVVDQIIAAGSSFPRWRAYSGHTVLWERSIYQLIGMSDPTPDSRIPYPETWMLPQWRTEEILWRRLEILGVEVEYHSELTALAITETSVGAHFSQNGEPQCVYARFVVGADGGRSTVRKLLGIDFVGETRENERYIIADVEAQGLETDIWHNWSLPEEPQQRVSMCPLPNTSSFQLVMPVFEDTPRLDLEAIQELFYTRSGRTDIELTNLTWASFHRVNLRLAQCFREEAIFLAGDAAHSPPPMGGQGLNLSIQDGYNLGWKLDAVLRGAPTSLLDTYEAERRPIAARLLGMDTPEETEADDSKPDIFQLRVNYRRSPLSRERRAGPGAVQAGDRAPNAVWQMDSGEAVSVFDLIRGPHFTLLTFSEEVRDACTVVVERWQGRAGFHVALNAATSHKHPEGVHAVYEVERDATVFVVRPDGYLGLIADRDAAIHLADYLASFLGAS